MLGTKGHVSVDIRLAIVRPYRAGEFNTFALVESSVCITPHSEDRSHLKPAKSVQSLPIKLED